MRKLRTLQGADRIRLRDELYAKYATSADIMHRCIYYRKKYSWMIVVGSAKIFKRLLDIVLSVFLLVFLSPLMLMIALLIKVTDGGSILYVTDRVGKWGKEFRFPKFRSMKVGAELLKESLMSYNELKEGVTFKIKRDPRITWIGRILRKTSLDELPQLWCVLKGEMSLVGPRPPLPEEVSLYTIQDRARLDVTPGLTCIWQVSGRSEIPFSSQVKLDREYIESQSFWLDLKLLLKTIPAVILGRGAY